MLAKVHSGAVYGVDAYAVEIEVNTGRGDPQTVIVGLPDALRLCSGQAAVKESPSTGSTMLLRRGSGQVTAGLLRVFDKDRVHTASSIPGFARNFLPTRSCSGGTSRCGMP